MGAPNLRTVDAELPDPPYPADTKANGWKPQFDVATIVSSDTWTLAEDDERPWLLRVWFECWNSVPAGSMPSDRRLFSRRIGCKVAFLNAHAEVLLRGWTRHNDDLLYHDHVTGQIREMLSKRINTKTKVAAWRERKKNKKVASTDDESVTGYQPVTTPDVTRCNRLVTDRKGKDKDKDKDKDLLLAEKKEKDNRLVDLAAPIDRDDPANIVFRYWQETMGHKRAKLDAKRKRAITARLREGHTVDEIKQAIDGCKASPWHQGKNDRQAKFDDIELICRDAVKLDRFRAAADQAAQQSNELDDWLNEDKILEGSFNVVG